MKRKRSLPKQILRIIFFPFVAIYDRILEKHLQVLEKKIRRELEVSLSHELKTPLTSIYAYSELLLDHLEDPEDQKALRVIHTRSQELLRLIDNMITISVLEFNPGSIEFSCVDFSQIVVQAVNRFKRFYPDTTMYNLEYQVTPDLSVWGEEKILFTLVYELISNAFLYRKQNVAAEIQVFLEQQEERALLTIRDHGQGIDPRNRDRIFQQFFRIEDRDRSSTPGLGIGLTLVKKILKVTQGQLQLNSEVGIGTEIAIDLPLRYPEN